MRNPLSILRATRSERGWALFFSTGGDPRVAAERATTASSWHPSYSRRDGALNHLCVLTLTPIPVRLRARGREKKVEKSSAVDPARALLCPTPSSY
jgi:hypothetical protein